MRARRRKTQQYRPWDPCSLKTSPCALTEGYHLWQAKGHVHRFLPNLAWSFLHSGYCSWESRFDKVMLPKSKLTHNNDNYSDCWHICRVRCQSTGPTALLRVEIYCFLHGDIFHPSTFWFLIHSPVECWDLLHFWKTEIMSFWETSFRDFQISF